ncbi:MAG: NAD(P)H-binding protein [Pseudomonadota bacterium]
MGKRILLLGATGTIGGAVALELSHSDHDLTIATRTKASKKQPGQIDIKELSNAIYSIRYDVIISCLSSRTGLPSDAWSVDYNLNVSTLEAAKANGVAQYILLSAICVQKPKLEFQRAKLAFEKELIGSGLTYTIIRPTAFFKSLSGQLSRVQKGKPYLVFGDGRLTACKPISDGDLARYIVSAIGNPDMRNKVLPIGGSGPALTPRDIGQNLGAVLNQEIKVKHVPVRLMRMIAGALGMLAPFSKRLAEKAELARIGHYYATESMLLWNEKTGQYDADATPEFGTETLDSYLEDLANGTLTDDRGAHKVF